MRAHTLSLAGLALVAGLTLTACDGGDSSAASEASSSAQGSGDSSQRGGNTPAPADKGSAPNESGSGSGSAPAGGASDACKTAQLDFSLSGGMGEGSYLVNLKNTGSAACTLQGFPGVDLKGKDGTISATRSKLTGPKVDVKPGEEARFTLHVPPNTSGGSGVTFTSLIVTPPNETHSHSVPASINLPASDKPAAITVDPVGVGK
ncbi:DUF4232 domain-containing protein [Streptomyces sp. NBC_01525]|uniref:DUF4232 domain-containing protein n=1 Tax=Streptomyces sp. NBC_01525 TaxID=2903893 RepID=UPI0038670A9F